MFRNHWKAWLVRVSVLGAVTLFASHGLHAFTIHDPFEY